MTFSVWNIDSFFQNKGGQDPKSKQFQFSVSKATLHVTTNKVWGKKRDTFKNWPLIKNPQFLSYPHKTCCTSWGDDFHQVSWG